MLFLTLNLMFNLIGNYYYHFILLRVFHSSVLLMASHWSLSDSLSPIISRTFLSILTNRINSLVWMVFTRLFISKYTSLCTNPLVTVPCALITIGINVTFMFHIFQFSSKVYVFISLLAFLQCYPVISRNSKVHYSAGSLFFIPDYHKVWSSGRH